MSQLATHILTFDQAQAGTKDPNSPLAYQDSFIRYLPALNDKSQEESYNLLHFYPYQEPNVLLGAKDTRLTQLNQGLSYLQEKGYDTFIRPHGGLAVVNDLGILNLAIVSDTRLCPLSIDQAYQQMVDLIQATLDRFNVKVEAFEIPNSYCPGKFDLVLHGKKIGGIAQRRFKSGVTTAAYLSVNGDQESRGELIRTFYQKSEADASYPDVDPSSMTTIEREIHTSITVQLLQSFIIHQLSQQTQVSSGDWGDPALEAIYRPLFDKLILKNQALKQ